MKINKNMIKEAIKNSLLEMDDAWENDRKRRIASGEQKQQYWVIFAYQEYPESKHGMANLNAFIAKDHKTAEKIKAECEADDMIAIIFTEVEIE